MVWIKRNRDTELSLGFRNLAAPHVRDAESVANVRIGRADSSRLRMMLQSEIDVPSLRKEHPQVMMSKRIVRGDGDSVTPERYTVPPNAHLQRRQHTEPKHKRDCACRQTRSKPTQPLNEISSTPCDDNEQTNVRDVRVAISSRLEPDLQQTDYRDERSQEPEPPYWEIRCSPAATNCDEGH